MHKKNQWPRNLITFRAIGLLIIVSLLIGSMRYKNLSSPARIAAVQLDEYIARNELEKLHQYNRVESATVELPSFEYYLLSNESDIGITKNSLKRELQKLGYQTDVKLYEPGEEVEAGCSFTFSPRDDDRCAAIGYTTRELTSSTLNNNEPFWIVTGVNQSRQMYVRAEITDNTFSSGSNDEFYGSHTIAPGRSVISIVFSSKKSE